MWECGFWLCLDFWILTLLWITGLSFCLALLHSDVAGTWLVLFCVPWPADHLLYLMLRLPDPLYLSGIKLCFIQPMCRSYCSRSYVIFKKNLFSFQMCLCTFLTEQICCNSAQASAVCLFFLYVWVAFSVSDWTYMSADHSRSPIYSNRYQRFQC